jgi:hypothetical protein
MSFLNLPTKASPTASSAALFNREPDDKRSTAVFLFAIAFRIASIPAPAPVFELTLSIFLG